MGVIRTIKLTKEFGPVAAILDVDIDITPGAITGFLGPNGAGKSTTMNILMGFISASSGEARLFDEKVSVGNARARRDVGFLSNSASLDKSLTVAQEIGYFGHLAGGYDRNYVSELVDRLGLDVTQKIGKLSTGNYQKVGLVVALMHKPKLLVLDEPTNGLDPLVQAEFNKIILELKESGSTIFISSHILSEVQELCDEFIFIRRGKIVAKSTKSELMMRSQDSLTVKPSPKQRAALLEFLKKQGINYKVNQVDLESEFMKYYEDDHA